MNRRQNYRHEFGPTRCLGVRLESPESHVVLQGELMNLSVGGIGVFVSAKKAEEGKIWIANFTLQPGSLSLRVPAERVFVRNAAGMCCGFRFMDELAETAAEHREKMIWKYLLDEQRRRRRILLGL